MRDHDDDELEDGEEPAEGKPRDYWARRQHMLYYQVVRIVAQGLARDARSIIDVGSWDTPTLDWFPETPSRTSLDLRMPYRGDGVQAVTADFLTWQPDRRYDLALCLQVLEHVADARGFAQKLLAVADIVLISVPYRWPETKNPRHVHDPVTMDKIVSWFGRPAGYTVLVPEPLSGVERLVCVFDPSGRPWTSITELAGGRPFRPARGVLPYDAIRRPLTIRQSLNALRLATQRRLAKTLGRSPRGSR
jgi:hypothetical protein